MVACAPAQLAEAAAVLREVLHAGGYAHPNPNPYPSPSSSP